MVLVDSECAESGGVDRRHSLQPAAEMVLHETPDAGSTGSVCWRWSTVWYREVWLDAAYW